MTQFGTITPQGRSSYQDSMPTVNITSQSWMQRSTCPIRTMLATRRMKFTTVEFKSLPRDRYTTFDRGNATRAFLTNPDGSLYIGEVWPGYTVYPDWLGSAGPWWANEMVTYYGKIKFDGIWIDMSEVSSFCVGSCGSVSA